MSKIQLINSNASIVIFTKYASLLKGNYHFISYITLLWMKYVRSTTWGASGRNAGFILKLAQKAGVTIHCDTSV